jgi:CheY-like chemotaxis protein
VLVVEDDDELRSLISLLDLALPGLGGQAFADAYRRGQGRAKIIVMSEATTAGETSARVRAAAFLSIPFDVETLLGVVRRVMPAATA